MTGGWKICPACRTPYRHPASACSRECLIATGPCRRCEVCGELHLVVALTVTLINNIWRCRDELLCAWRAVERTSDADRAAMRAGLDEAWRALERNT